MLFASSSPPQAIVLVSATCAVAATSLCSSAALGPRAARHPNPLACPGPHFWQPRPSSKSRPRTEMSARRSEESVHRSKESAAG
ncbi:hypothetical protein BC828DRAFT_165748 [Blastocladiella britannica]|nr:hypothetical protein BC828DRAFT_165748 [Blastocladiella britannica]